MPIQEAHRRQALQRVTALRDSLIKSLSEVVEDMDAEDLQMGVSEELSLDEELWRSAVEENNYMEVVYTEIMEHHDGAYLKATFRNSVEGAHADRYVSIRSSGRVEIAHAFFVDVDGVRVRVERKPDGSFTGFFKAV